MARNFRSEFIVLIIVFLLICSLNVNSNSLDVLSRLQQAYPQQIIAIETNYLLWADGTKLSFTHNNESKSFYKKLTSPSLLDQVEQINYPTGHFIFNPTGDPGRIRYEPFFRKMYGNSKKEVESQLTTIYWLPEIFGSKYPLLVTRINDVDKKLSSVSHDLEILVRAKPDYIKYLKSPSGTFKWRVIAHTERLSPHSFGMSIDLNDKYGNYWQWDLKKEHRKISETTLLNYRNQIPLEIVAIFEKYGFIWGGKWYHYDTIHFEYRPEILLNSH